MKPFFTSAQKPTPKIPIFIYFFVSDDALPDLLKWLKKVLYCSYLDNNFKNNFIPKNFFIDVDTTNIKKNVSNTNCDMYG